ncbi:MAG TPA: PqqD family protein [Pyrinomonadaceae bacterium]
MEKKHRELKPLARKDGLLVRELPDEVLVYDLKGDKALCLNSTAALVWKRCDGRTTVGELTRLLGDDLGAAVDVDVVWYALGQLDKINLLEGREDTRAATTRTIRRRDLLRRVGVAALTLPVVMAITAPSAQAQASLNCSGGTNRPAGCPCGSNNQCASNNCLLSNICA